MRSDWWQLVGLPAPVVTPDPHDSHSLESQQQWQEVEFFFCKQCHQQLFGRTLFEDAPHLTTTGISNDILKPGLIELSNQIWVYCKIAPSCVWIHLNHKRSASWSQYIPQARLKCQFWRCIVRYPIKCKTPCIRIQLNHRNTLIEVYCKTSCIGILWLLWSDLSIKTRLQDKTKEMMLNEYYLIVSGVARIAVCILQSQHITGT